MGRHSYNEHSGAQFEDSHPGCMWGIRHILDNNHWHQVRKMLPYRRHRRGRRTRCNGSSTTILYDHATGEVQECMESETNCLIEKQRAKEMFKEENRKCRIRCYPARSHFEQQHYCDICPDWTSQNPSLPMTPEELVICSRKCNLCSNTNSVDYMGHSHLVEKHEHLPEKCDGVMEALVNKEVLHHQLKEYADVLEIVKVHKGLFLEILQDADVGVAKQFNGQQTANPNKRFSKSRSFPTFDSSLIRNVTSSTLEHKQNEIWFFPKGKKYLLAGTKPPKLAAAICPKNYDLQQMTLMVDNNVGSATEQQISFSSLGLAHSLNNQGMRRLLVNLFKDIKQKIKHALKESKKERTTGQDGMDVPRNSLGTESSYYDSCSKGRLHNIRKSSSLNESLDKYTRLFEYSFGEETKGHHSKSLRLINEEKVLLSTWAPRSHGRNLSMPDLESFCSLLNEVSSDVLCTGMAVSTFVDHSTNTECDKHNDQPLANIHVKNTEKIQPPQTLVKTEFQENKVKSSDSNASIAYPTGLVGRNNKEFSKPCDISEDTVDLIMMESCPHQEKEIGLVMKSSSEFAQPVPVSVLETCYPDSETNPAEFPIADGSEFNPRSKHLNFDNIESTSKSVGSHFLHSKLDEKDDADFNYVKNVLELSGLIGDGHLGTWHSKEQPLNRSLFEKLEACYPHELECSEEDVVGNWDHQFLFNLVNEAILDVQERSVGYFPKAMPFSCCIRSMPIGRHFLHHVWTRINRYSSSRPEVEQTLDDPVTRDLAEDDGWLNLLFETDCVALELEKLIFEELIDEVICS